MPSYDEQDGRWHLMYVSYYSAPSNASGWYNNYGGQIWHAVSQTPGPAGIAGPYHDTGIVLQVKKLKKRKNGGKQN